MQLPASALLEPLRHLSLLSPEQLREAEALGAEPGAMAETVAAGLKSRGFVTAYQAEELGAGRGFFLAVGQYVLLDRLGAGGMGEVFRARHRLLAREVALKRMKEDVRGQPGAAARFLREAEAAA